MKRLALGLLLAIAGTACAGTPIGGSVLGHQIRRFHDDSVHVTCWTVLGEGAISCLPDTQLAVTHTEKGQ